MVDGSTTKPSFLCDAMLGSLAKWLRRWGYDTLYLGTAPADDELAARARRDGRWLLTRDRELAAVGPRTMLIATATVDAQQAEVFGRLGLSPVPDLERCRCSECNGELAPATAAEVAAHVPPYVLRTAVRFRHCRGCGRVYWPGTHVVRIRRRMEAVLARVATAAGRPL